MHGWQADLKRTCASPVTFRVLPENEIPPFDGGIFIILQGSCEKNMTTLLTTLFCIFMSFYVFLCSCHGCCNARKKPAIPYKSRDCGLFSWQGHKDSNSGHAVLETAALPTELYPYLKFCLFIIALFGRVVNGFFGKVGEKGAGSRGESPKLPGAARIFSTRF